MKAVKKVVDSDKIKEKSPKLPKSETKTLKKSETKGLKSPETKKLSVSKTRAKKIKHSYKVKDAENALLLKLKDGDVVIVCPVDPYVEDDYFLKLKELSEVAERGQYNITLMGVAPTEPSEKYGYIIPETEDDVSKVKSFKEKPSKEIAAEYIKEGGLWNCGVFAFKIGYLLKN